MGDDFVQWFALNNKRVLDALKPAQESTSQEANVVDEV